MIKYLQLIDIDPDTIYTMNMIAPTDVVIIKLLIDILAVQL